MLLDLGVSSHQLDAGARGFSFRFDGPLDMRMEGGLGDAALDHRAPAAPAAAPPAAAAAARLTAARVVNEWPEYELRLCLARLGEEPKAVPIARAILAARPLGSTRELREVVERTVYGAPKAKAKSVARVFQAVRIAVNDELGSLERALLCLLYTSPSPRDRQKPRMPSSA